jgi:hypothetical protein
MRHGSNGGNLHATRGGENMGKHDTAELERLRAENAALKAKEAERHVLRCKVSDKGAVSLYGVHARFPVTLYADQWERVLAKADGIRAFIKENEAGLTRKNAA